MKKRSKYFLCISIIVFTVSIVFFIIDTVITTKNSYAMAIQDDIYGAGGEWFWVLMNILFVPTPFLLSEIAFIKSGYTLLEAHHPKNKKHCYVISAFLSLMVMILIPLVTNDIICLEYAAKNNILLMLWPCVIVSLILGFAHRNKK